MVLFVSISFNKFVAPALARTRFGIMNAISPLITSQLSPSLNQRDMSQRLTLAATISLSSPIYAAESLIHQGACFVGVNQEVNCKDIISRDRMAKKNTRVRSPSVFRLVCYTKNLVTPNIAHSANLYKRFVSCYV